MVCVPGPCQPHAQGARLALAVVAQATLAAAGRFTYLAQLLAQVGQYAGVVGGAWCGSR